MIGKSISTVLVVGVCCFLLGHGSAATADEKDEVNNFYKTAIQTIKKPAHLKELVELVQKNPAIAKRCVDVCAQKSQEWGEKAEALRMIQDELRLALLMASKSTKCDQEYWRLVMKVLTPGHEDDDQIFCLERLTKACPRAGEAYSVLGDLYLKQRRCGMAVTAYQASVELTGDKDSQELLQEAKECKDDYVAQKPIRYAQVKDLVSRERTMAPQRVTVRKAQIGNSIQRQVLFDEWSYQIKDQFLPGLKVIGKGLKEELSKHDGVRLLIEGHTDRRGPYERNMQLSRDRAEAIKNYLVQNHAINSSQLVTHGYGPTRPYDEGDNEAVWALNRRVEFKKFD